MKNLTQLKHLQLGYTAVTDISAITQLKNLESLNLINGRIGDADIKDLANLKKLKHLNLANVQLSKAAVSDLQKALPNCKIIHSAK